MSHDPLSKGAADAASNVSADRLPGPAARASGVAVGAASDPVLPPAESLTIAGVAMLHGCLLGRLDVAGEFVIDPGDLGTIDGAGLKLLAAFATGARAQVSARRHEGKNNVIELF